MEDNKDKDGGIQGRRSNLEKAGANVAF